MYNDGRDVNATRKTGVYKQKETISPIEERHLRFSEFAKHSVDGIEGRVDLFTNLDVKDQNQSAKRPMKIATLAPVNTILPETKINSTTFGLSMR